MNKGDLSYDCEMNGDNEIALLCRSMNDMRKQLLANKKQTWEMMEQQRLVNAAFAHDIRNPLTVMKGHIRMIRKFYPSGKLTEEKLMGMAEGTDNLMTNELRYADTFVTVTVETTDEKLMIYVQDDWAGFSEKNLEKAGRPYFTTEKDHLGMGLAICRLLCKKHGGDLELINSIQKGGIVCAIFKFSEKVDKLLGI